MLRCKKQDRGFYVRALKMHRFTPHSPPGRADTDRLEHEPFLPSAASRHCSHPEPIMPFDNHFARLPALYYSRVLPAGLPNPYWIGHSPEAADLLDLDNATLLTPAWLSHLSGQTPPEGAEPLAAVYSGHQFGIWARQLGDGRAHLLGAWRNRHGDSWEIQLKGSGPTPYARGADGRAVLRSSIREFLCSEAMVGLGIPTTRALALVGAPLPVRRERIETAAIVTRLAPSFVRFGSFEHWASRGNLPALRGLADYLIDRFHPACRDSTTPYADWLATVAQHTGTLIAEWMAAGFMHGVMNTDNLSILGLTLDYGPFGFMEAFDAEHVCNHSDDQGRYRFNNQPAIGQWNLYRLAEAVAPLLGDEETARDLIDAHYGPAFNQRFAQRLRDKLGLYAEHPDDEAFFTRCFALLQEQHPDYTLFFRGLSGLSVTVDRENPGKSEAAWAALCADPAAATHWLAEWRQRQAQTPWPDPEARQAHMRAHNPRYILRNWVAESVIRAAEQGDFALLERLRRCLTRPYDEHPELADFAAPPPAWATGLCVSCSS